MVTAITFIKNRIISAYYIVRKPLKTNGLA